MWAAILTAGTLGANYATIADYYRNGKSGLNIEGIWLSEYGYPAANSYYSVRETTEYFKNGNYNVVGEIGVTAKNEDTEVFVLYQVDGAGVWETDSETITVTLNDMQSVPKSFLINGEASDINLLRLFPGFEDAFEFIMPKGTSDELQIVEVAKDTITVKQDDPLGNIFEHKMTKQSMRLQR